MVYNTQSRRTTQDNPMSVGCPQLSLGFLSLSTKGTTINHVGGGSEKIEKKIQRAFYRKKFIYDIFSAPPQQKSNGFEAKKVEDDRWFLKSRIIIPAP